MSGIRICRTLWPYEPEVFGDADFLAADDSEEPALSAWVFRRDDGVICVECVSTVAIPGHS